MAEFTTYITQQNDRWDLIAHKAYGDAARFPEIMSANPNIPASDVLPANLTIYVPVIESSTQDVNLLPPWKR